MAVDTVGAGKSEAAEEVEGGGQLVGDAGDEEAGAADEGLAEVGQGDGGRAEEEVEDGEDVGGGVGGEEGGVHSEDATGVGRAEAVGEEEVGGGAEGGEGDGSECGVGGEG